jgi:hypothetical protein
MAIIISYLENHYTNTFAGVLRKKVHIMLISKKACRNIWYEKFSSSFTGHFFINILQKSAHKQIRPNYAGQQ